MKNREFPSFAGLARRRAARPQAGYDIMRAADSWLAAHLADEVMLREGEHVTNDEAPGCWSATFRGVLSRLNSDSWGASIAFYLPPAWS